MALLLCIYQKQYLLERLETINRPPAGGLSPVRSPSIGSPTNIHSDLPRNRYIGRMNDVMVNPCGNPRGLMSTNKRKLQEGQIQAVPKVFFERLKTHVQPLAGQHWTAHSLTTAYKNAFPTHVGFSSWIATDSEVQSSLERTHMRTVRQTQMLLLQQ